MKESTGGKINKCHPVLSFRLGKEYCGLRKRGIEGRRERERERERGSERASEREREHYTSIYQVVR